MPRLQVFLPCVTCPPELFYVGETDAEVVKVDVATVKGLVKGKKAVVTDGERFEKALAKARTRFPDVVKYTQADGTAICFAPTLRGGVIVGVSRGVEQDEKMLRWSLAKCG